jgi:hypothetical protein
MGQKLVVGPLPRGLRNDVTPFNVDNDSFPVLINAYQWRGRVKRKRGTSLLGRLSRYFNSTSTAYSAVSSINLTGGAANILTGFGLQASGNIIPGSVSITDITSGNVYTDNSLGVLTGVPSGTGTIIYSTGAITISGGASDTIQVFFRYYPVLPVMGFEDLILGVSDIPGNLAFDTKYSYNVTNTFPYSIYDVSFYKNPAASSALPGYVPKTTWTPTTWNSQDYQQIWSVNYQGALWATNGITVPFDNTNIGMQYKPIVAVTVAAPIAPSMATVNLQITGHGLVIGDFIFVNEVATTTGINFQTGYVIAVPDANNVTVDFPFATIATNGTGGIAQYLTNRSDVTKDCLRFYDGDPTNGNATTPGFLLGHGWVNFAPPLSQAVFSIADLPQAQYYLVGARMIVPFKDRLLFLGPVIQTSAVNSQVYLRDTIIYSQNGTPYYTTSYSNPVTIPPSDNPTSPTNNFFPILLPNRQTSTSPAYFEDQTGFGGFISAGVDQAINTVADNEDVLLVGFNNLQTRLVYSGNDIVPFNFFVINSELGSSSVFSAVNLDKGALTRGNRGFTITSQTGTARIDPEIPDEVFKIPGKNNANERMCAQRDFINEWIYFTYPVNTISYKFPNQTLQYNYRDNSWAIFKECYTTYGTFRKRDGLTWATVGKTFPTWGEWDEPWNSGGATVGKPKVVGGNQQGFLLIRDDGTDEDTSLEIQSFSASQVTSPNHCLNETDFIVISGAIGTIASQVNGKIFQVSTTTDNTFVLNPPISGGTYFGGGLITRMYVPFIQTKQFPTAWDMARKTRIGVQQYLLTKTDDAQITLLIYLSQNAANPYNAGKIVPEIGSNNSLIYSSVLYTCTESTNLGLLPTSANMQNAANTNLQMISNIYSTNPGSNASSPQSQIWHRMNTSLIGDTIQIGFTMSDEQMTDPDFKNQFEEIELHGFILDVTPASLLA